MTSTRAVLDTNIWVASIHWWGKPYQIRKYAEQGIFTSVLSLAILTEVMYVLRTHFRLSDEEAYEWYCRLGESAEIVFPVHPLNVVVDDPDDNKFVECAVEGHAAYLVSRDNDLLRLGQYEKLQIVDDAEFLESLSQVAVHP